ncbi:adenylyltransferase/cytidyltransferase family protein [Candidatus Peregrinibacteria bacterium]|nr:adenylyltransferase/cytidyltransferase family protein [Candidatus Peregrinibacteria bacterium]
MVENEDKKIVMAFGTFDVFHAGHEHFLREAKTLGDELIVVLARDNTVKNVKGEYPKHNEKKRMEQVKNTGIAHKVIMGSDDDKYKAIKKYKPHIIALGYDQFVFTYTLNKLIIDEGMNTKIVRLEAYEPDIYKSSLIKIRHEEDEKESQKKS